MNCKLVSSIHADTDAALAKAQQDYYAILFDAKRTSAADKADMDKALELLGKTPDDMHADLEAFARAHTLAAEAADFGPANQAAAEAEAALNTFLKETLPAMQRSAEEAERVVQNARSAARNRRDAALRAAADLRKLRTETLRRDALMGPRIAPDPDDIPATFHLGSGTYVTEAGPKEHTL